MITRLVKLSFDPARVNDFLQLFEKTQPAIAGFAGCRGVKLMKDVDNPNVYFTYSLWDSTEALENYRGSELFKSTWQQTRQWFNGKPAAWSLSEQHFPSI